MNRICIISSDKLFARMLELELTEIGLSVKLITEKLNVPALKLAVDNSEAIVFDNDYYNGNADFIEASVLPFIVFSKNKAQNTPENVTAFFERPFPVSELIEHIKSRYSISGGEADDPYAFNGIGSMELDPFSKQVTVNGTVIKFSPREFSLLSLLYKNRGRIVSRQEVIDTVWGSDYDAKNNADNVYINYLRKKLDDRFGVKMIYTVRGKGYMMK